MFTIIFPVLNERLRLESGVTRTVEYLRKIAFEDYEIIIVDNGSEDETPQIAEMLCQKYEKVRYERINVRGVGAAFRRGVELSHGDVVGYMDIDLSTNIKHLGEAIHFFETHPPPASSPRTAAYTLRSAHICRATASGGCFPAPAA